MSAEPSFKTNLITNINASILEQPTTEVQARLIAQMGPEEARELAEIDLRVLFRASQLGMIAAKDWQERADWTSVYLRAIGPSGDI